jgi:hypothetical protein
MESFSVMTTAGPVFDMGVPSRPLANILASLEPTAAYAVWLQRAISSFSFVILLNTYFLAKISVTVGHVLANYAYVVTRLATILSGKAIKGVWDSKSVVTLRNKVFHEFATFILGGGNGIFLMIFWPGWWVLGGTVWAAWMFCG